MGTSFADPLLENENGDEIAVNFNDPKVQNSSVIAVSNSTVAGGGAAIVRTNPPYTRSNP